MSTAGLHSAREELGLPHVHSSGHLSNSSSAFLNLGNHHDANQHGGLPKPLSLSPRTFGMEDLRDFCGPLGAFKTGLTPRVFSTGLTPRSGFTPRFTTGFTPRINTGLGQTPTDTNAFFTRNTGFSPRATEGSHQKISPTGFTPKDVSGMKAPMRYQGSFNSNSPSKMGMNEPMHMHKPQMHHPQQLHHQMSHDHHNHPGQMGPDMSSMNMPMYDYMNRPGIPPQQQQPPQIGEPRSNVSPSSADHVSDQEDLDERRRMKNRERVRKCRKRKQDRLNFLEDRTAELEKENHDLKAKIARKSMGIKEEPFTEAQVKELRKKQNTTLASYIRAYNEVESGAFEASASSIWTGNAEIVYGTSSSRIEGIDNILANKQASSAVFASYKIKQYTVQWKQHSNDKCVVNWEIDVILKPDAVNNVPMTSPFAEIAPHFNDGEVLSFHLISHLTFNEDKIAEEIRQLNLSQIAEMTLTKFAQDPKKAADVLRSLIVTA